MSMSFIPGLNTLENSGTHPVNQKFSTKSSTTTKKDSFLSYPSFFNRIQYFGLVVLSTELSNR